jgi:serine/threonine protein kinase
VASEHHPRHNDRGDHDGQLWIAIDYVDGADAGHILSSRNPAGMPVDLATKIVTSVAEALDYSHRQGLLHRDVKPANIMVTDPDDDHERRVLLADFGIARSAEDISGLTATNMTVGTVAYTAPEQLVGEPLDGRPRRATGPDNDTRKSMDTQCRPDLTPCQVAA